jgi:cysteine-rich repeat protein
MAKLGYLLVGKECQVPKCADGQYFKWNNFKDSFDNYLGECANCDSTCKKCVGPLNNDCVQCSTGLQINELNQCVACKFINSGFILNEENECEDKCGDGVIVNKPCDDNNTFSGDGCSKNCMIEFGYVCDKAPGLPCREIIPPTFAITANSKTN